MFYLSWLIFGGWSEISFVFSAKIVISDFWAKLKKTLISRVFKLEYEIRDFSYLYICYHVTKFSTGSESRYAKVKGGHFCPPPGPRIDFQTPVLIGLRRVHKWFQRRWRKIWTNFENRKRKQENWNRNWSFKGSTCERCLWKYKRERELQGLWFCVKFENRSGES